jgi:hypothetical protein
MDTENKAVNKRGISEAIDVWSAMAMFKETKVNQDQPVGLDKEELDELIGVGPEYLPQLIRKLRYRLIDDMVSSKEDD